MTTPQTGQTSGTRQPGAVVGALPNRTKVTVSSLPKPPYEIEASRLSDRGTIQYLIAGTWYLKWDVRVMPETVPLNSGARERPSRDVDHKILVDADAAPSNWAAMKTPGGLNQIRDAQRKAAFGTDPAAQPKVGGLTVRTDPEFSKFARVVVDAVTAAEGVRIRITVLSNLRHMAVPHDLVPITLERDDTTTLDTIIVLTPRQEDGNVCEFEAYYTYRQLAQLLKFTVPQDEPPADILDLLQRRCPELGVKAQWFTSKAELRAAPLEQIEYVGRTRGRSSIPTPTTTFGISCLFSAKALCCGAVLSPPTKRAHFFSPSRDGPSRSSPGRVNASASRPRCTSSATPRTCPRAPSRRSSRTRWWTTRSLACCSTASAPTSRSPRPADGWPVSSP